MTADPARQPRGLPAWLQVVGDVALPILLFTGGIVGVIRGHHENLVVAVLTTLAVTAPLAFRRHFPVHVFVLVSLGAFAQWTADISLKPHDFAVLIALYSVAAYSERTWSVPALAVSMVGGIAGWWRFSEQHAALGLLAPIVVPVAAWVIGDNVGTRRAYLTALEERAERLEREQHAQARAAVAEERARIAREMHDVVAHRVGVIVAQAEGASYAVDREPDKARAALGVIADSGREALTELRRMLGVLRDQDTPEVLPQPGLADIDGLVTSMRSAGLPVTYTVEGVAGHEDTGVGLTAFRLVQESLTNTLKHAGPNTPTEVLVRYLPTSIDITVTDHSSTVPNGPRGVGHGLVGMRERVGMYDGKLDAGPLAAGGWRVHAVLPAAAGRT